MASAETVTVSVFPRGFNWPSFVGQDKGFFEQNGITVTLQSTSSSVAQMTGLSQGAFDIAMTAFDNVVACVEGQGEAPIGAQPEFFAFMDGDSGFLKLSRFLFVRSSAARREVTEVTEETVVHREAEERRRREPIDSVRRRVATPVEPPLAAPFVFVHSVSPWFTVPSVLPAWLGSLQRREKCFSARHQAHVVFLYEPGERARATALLPGPQDRRKRPRGRRSRTEAPTTTGIEAMMQRKMVNGNSECRFQNHPTADPGSRNGHAGARRPRRRRRTLAGHAGERPDRHAQREASDVADAREPS